MQRLLSNPGVHSVESIERQQRLESVSPNIESLTLSGKKVHLLDTAEPKLLSPMAFDQAQKGGSGGSALPRKAKETFEVIKADVLDCIDTTFVIGVACTYSPELAGA